MKEVSYCQNHTFILNIIGKEEEISLHISVPLWLVNSSMSRLPPLPLADAHLEASPGQGLYILCVCVCVCVCVCSMRGSLGDGGTSVIWQMYHHTSPRPPSFLPPTHTHIHTFPDVLKPAVRGAWLLLLPWWPPDPDALRRPPASLEGYGSSAQGLWINCTPYDTDVDSEGVDLPPTEMVVIVGMFAFVYCQKASMFSTQ